MRHNNPDVLDPSQQRQKALSRWDDEGGLIPGDMHSEVPERSEEHTSELQSLTNLVCRLLLEKKPVLHFKIVHITRVDRAGHAEIKLRAGRGAQRIQYQPSDRCVFFLMIRRPPRFTPFPYAALFR